MKSVKKDLVLATMVSMDLHLNYLATKLKGE